MLGRSRRTRTAARRTVAQLGACATLLAMVASGIAAQPATGDYRPIRCVSDTTAALSAASDIATVDSVAPGISYRCFYVRRGPWAIHVVSVDLESRQYSVEGARALGTRLGREKVSDMMRRAAAGAGGAPLVAINADFFNLQTGEVRNNTVIRGEWVQGVLTSDAPRARFARSRTQFAVDEEGRPLIARFDLDALVQLDTMQRRLLGINARPVADSGLVLYTPWQGERTPRDSSTRDVSEIAFAAQPGAGVDQVFGVQHGSLANGGGLAIPRDGVVLSGAGPEAALLRSLASNSSLRLRARLAGHAAAPRTVVGGWPRLIVDSVSIAARADSLEGTAPSFSAARHPRSAIALSRDSSTLLLVVVDGRRPWSVGMSLTELADQLLALGAYQAMNLDGGGSSTLWVRGAVVNYPSDAAGERSVGNALMIVPSPR